MRSYDVALFTFIFMFMLSMFEQLGLTGASYTMAESWDETAFESAYSGLNESVQSASKEVQESTPNYFFESIKLAVQGFRAFATAFIGSTVLVPELFRGILHGLGMSEGQAALLGYPLGIFVWIIYIVGMIQLAAGRSMKEMV